MLCDRLQSLDPRLPRAHTSHVFTQRFLPRLDVAMGTDSHLRPGGILGLALAMFLRDHLTLRSVIIGTL